ncbi:hypothetical protein PUN28_005521 [Cardiocondyla obscurior]|uniref:Uncharacterized protein n=1 Tax=Cardiocondyla obscurior TaxID=286306 RepID=A0AAW2GI10_9HYME
MRAVCTTRGGGEGREGGGKGEKKKSKAGEKEEEEKKKRKKKKMPQLFARERDAEKENRGSERREWGPTAGVTGKRGEGKKRDGRRRRKERRTTVEGRKEGNNPCARTRLARGAYVHGRGLLPLPAPMSLRSLVAVLYGHCVQLYRAIHESDAIRRRGGRREGGGGKSTGTLTTM